LDILKKTLSVAKFWNTLLKVENNYVWILEAKAQNQGVLDSDNLEQAYSYVVHP
jgi:hypothetical protein